jgi:hypothetical protein
MFWNDPEHCLESIILIKDEDNILSIPRQIQVFCICLGLSQANTPVSYTVYTLYNVQCTHCTNQLLETNSAVLCTHSTAKLFSHVETISSQAGPESRRTWERTVDCPSYNAVGEALKPSVQGVQGFPAFERLGIAPLPGGPVLLRPKPQQQWQLSLVCV